MSRRALPFAALLLFAFCAEALARQTPANPPAAGQSQSAEGPKKSEDAKKAEAASRKPGAARYADLLEKLKKGDRSTDFTELRMSYAESDQYSPYGGDRDARRAMFAAINAGNWDEAWTQSAKILEKNYVDINGHFGAFVSSKRKGEEERAQFHKYVFEGLVKSVQGGGDGRSMEKAFVVISTDEEYALLNVLGLRPMGQSLMTGGGHSYDKFSAVDPETKKTYEFYFQIDKPFGWLGRSLK